MRIMAETPLAAAPGAQDHPSLALINSAGYLAGGRGYDDISTPEAATAWLMDRDLIGPDAVLYEHCRCRLAALRADLRDLLTARITGSAPTMSAVHALNAALMRIPSALLLRFDAQAGFTRRAEHPVTQLVEHVMAVIADDAASLLTGDEAPHLASCDANPCQRLFVRTHARRQWCSIRCGDRIRAARAYSRKRSIHNAQGE
jgi:predicted RNA-binding Zn ribbon-like protein